MGTIRALLLGMNNDNTGIALLTSTDLDTLAAEIAAYEAAEIADVNAMLDGIEYL